jgi:PilZ domain
MQEVPKYFRRLKTRVETREEVWVCWSHDGRDQFSKIRNIGMGGIFIETAYKAPVGVKTKIDFLAQEGHITAEAAVRHANPKKGLGMKFTAVSDADRRRLEALIKRLTSS